MLTMIFFPSQLVNTFTQVQNVDDFCHRREQECPPQAAVLRSSTACMPFRKTGDCYCTKTLASISVIAIFRELFVFVTPLCRLCFFRSTLRCMLLGSRPTGYTDRLSGIWHDEKKPRWTRPHKNSNVEKANGDVNEPTVVMLQAPKRPDTQAGDTASAVMDLVKKKKRKKKHERHTSDNLKEKDVFKKGQKKRNTAVFLSHLLC